MALGPGLWRPDVRLTRRRSSPANPELTSRRSPGAGRGPPPGGISRHAGVRPVARRKPRPDRIFEFDPVADRLGRPRRRRRRSRRA